MKISSQCNFPSETTQSKPDMKTTTKSRLVAKRSGQTTGSCGCRGACSPLWMCAQHPLDEEMPTAPYGCGDTHSPLWMRRCPQHLMDALTAPYGCRGAHSTLWMCPQHLVDAEVPTVPCGCRDAQQHLVDTEVPAAPFLEAGVLNTQLLCAGHRTASPRAPWREQDQTDSCTVWPIQLSRTPLEGVPAQRREVALEDNL